MDVTDRIVEAARGLSAATAHEAAGRIGALPSAIKALSADMRICARAMPALSPAGDNLVLHHAMYEAEPGEVLVIDARGASEFGYWGEVMAVAAQARGLAGLVISGGVRDSQRMIELGFDVFSMGVCIRGTVKNPRGAGQVGEPVEIGDVTIRRGDLVLGDADGVVVIPAEQAEAVIESSRRRDKQELDIFSRLRGGETTLDIYELPDLARPNT